MAGAYGGNTKADNYSGGSRGNVGVSNPSKGGSKSGEQFFKNRTMQNTEGVMKKSSISRRQPS